MADQIDPGSATWRAVMAWAGEQLATSRAAIEAPGLAHAETEFQRGRIAALRALLKLSEPRKFNVADSTHVE